MPLEQAARQKVTELRSILESEKSQSSVLKAILEAKELKQIDGIYGRLGDLGAIDGDIHSCSIDLNLSLQLWFACKSHPKMHDEHNHGLRLLMSM